MRQGDTLSRDTWFGTASSKVRSAHVAQNIRGKEKIRVKKKHQVCVEKTLSGKREHLL